VALPRASGGISMSRQRSMTHSTRAPSRLLPSGESTSQSLRLTRGSNMIRARYKCDFGTDRPSGCPFACAMRSISITSIPWREG